MTRPDITALFARRHEARARLDAVVFFYELRDGRIARDRRICGFTGVLVQVGLLKAKLTDVHR
jgi:hypothetical protein